MRISDGSSDVCSSDLDVRPGPAEVGEVRPAVDRQPALVTVYVGVLIRVDDHRAEAVAPFGVGEVTDPVDQIGARGHGHEEIAVGSAGARGGAGVAGIEELPDRKSTRLNSSH